MSEQTEIQVGEGRYAIQVNTLKRDVDEDSAMAQFLLKTAVVTRKEAEVYLTLMFLDHETITGFQLENPEGEWIEAFKVEASEKQNRRYEMFELSRLVTPLHARVQYEAAYEGGTFKGDEVLRLAFDAGSVEEAE